MPPPATSATSAAAMPRSGPILRRPGGPAVPPPKPAGAPGPPPKALGAEMPALTPGAPQPLSGPGSAPAAEGPGMGEKAGRAVSTAPSGLAGSGGQGDLAAG